MSNKYKTQRVGKENIEFLHRGNGKPLVFLHGFGIPPTYYQHLLDKLSEHSEVIAPNMYAVNYLKNQPTSIDEYAELTSDFCTALQIGQHNMSGHSLGGAVSFRIGENSSEPNSIIGINPVLPIEYGLLGFTGRAIHKGIRESLGITGGLKALIFGNTFSMYFIYNLTKDIRSSVETISDISRFSYKNRKVLQPTLILYGNEDEFFNLNEEVEMEMQEYFENITIEILPGFNHDWPIFHPKRAAKEISDFLE